MNRKLTIVRGIPGAGKSSWVLANRPTAAIYSADQFFMVGNEYRFDPNRLAEAHATCLYGVMRALLARIEDVVADNTFVHHWEWHPYRCAADLAGYTTEVVEIMPATMDDVAACAARNVHGVPAATVYRMAAEFQPYGVATKIAATIKPVAPPRDGERPLVASARCRVRLPEAWY